MPTGYTVYIEDGTIDNAKSFITLCSRAFGAYVEMRDESLNTPIPDEFQPDSYYKDRLDQLKIELEKYSHMSLSEAQRLLDKEYIDEQENLQGYIKKETEIYNRYAKVLKEVRLWNPPTTEHKNLKDFAIEQIEMCLPNLDSSYWKQKLNKEKISAEQWLVERIQKCERDVAYNQNAWEEEVKRINGRNKWIKELRNSFDN